MNKLPIILFRPDESNKQEFELAKQYFEVITQRAEINKRETVLCRYSCLPYMKELENDVNILGGKLFNSYKNHQYCADIQQWYSDLEEYTFPTWFSVEEIPLSENGPFVIKGRTNSRKFQWKSKMFAKDRSDVGRVVGNLMDDPFIAEQGLVFRKYIPLKTITESLQGLRITEEFRFFFVKIKDYFSPFCIGESFYWGAHLEDIQDVNRTLIPYSASRLASKIANIVCEKVNFVCVDIGIKEDGDPILIELNDGCMAGLSCINPDKFYRNLKDAF